MWQVDDEEALDVSQDARIGVVFSFVMALILHQRDREPQDAPLAPLFIEQGAAVGMHPLTISAQADTLTDGIDFFNPTTVEVRSSAAGRVARLPTRRE